jgi:hypothetical protein
MRVNRKCEIHRAVIDTVKMIPEALDGLYDSFILYQRTLLTTHSCFLNRGKVLKFGKYALYSPA